VKEEPSPARFLDDHVRATDHHGCCILDDMALLRECCNAKAVMTAVECAAELVRTMMAVKPVETVKAVKRRFVGFVEKSPGARCVSYVPDAFVCSGCRSTNS
jgi:hypothetical protein